MMITPLLEHERTENSSIANSNHINGDAAVGITGVCEETRLPTTATCTYTYIYIYVCTHISSQKKQTIKSKSNDTEK